VGGQWATREENLPPGDLPISPHPRTMAVATSTVVANLVATATQSPSDRGKRVPLGIKSQVSYCVALRCAERALLANGGVSPLMSRKNKGSRSTCKA